MKSNYLVHHGVKGMKWGVRRYQNPDGTLTAKGISKYKKKDGSLTRKGRKIEKRYDKMSNKGINEITKQLIDENIEGEAVDRAVIDINKYMQDNNIDLDNEEQLTKTMALLDEYTETHYREIMQTTVHNNETFKKAKKYVEKHNMTQWSDPEHLLEKYR